MVEVSERSFEKTIECGLLRYGPAECGGETKGVRETAAPYGSSRPEDIENRHPRNMTWRCACYRATSSISSLPPSRRNGKGSSSIMARPLRNSF